LREFRTQYSLQNQPAHGGVMPPVTERFRELENALRGGRGTQKQKQEYRKLQSERIVLRDSRVKEFKDFHDALNSATSEWFKENYKTPEHLLEVLDLYNDVCGEFGPNGGIQKDLFTVTGVTIR
jgi:hypothetical protein